MLLQYESLSFGLHSQLLCTITIEFLQAQENKELKKALKLTRCAQGDPTKLWYKLLIYHTL